MNDVVRPNQGIGSAMEVTPSPWTLARILLALGAAGPMLFLVIATLAGIIDPRYDMRAQPVSELAVGPYGWLMTANFYIFGLAILAFALGFYRSLGRGSRVGTASLVVAGLGRIGSGLFPTDRQRAQRKESAEPNLPLRALRQGRIESS